MLCSVIGYVGHPVIPSHTHMTKWVIRQQNITKWHAWVCSHLLLLWLRDGEVKNEENTLRLGSWLTLWGDPCYRPTCNDPTTVTTFDSESWLVHGDITPFLLFNVDQGSTKLKKIRFATEVSLKSFYTFWKSKILEICKILDTFAWCWGWLIMPHSLPGFFLLAFFFFFFS